MVLDALEKGFAATLEPDVISLGTKQLRLAICSTLIQQDNSERRCQEPLVASLLMVVRPGAPSSALAPSSDALCS